MDKLKTDTPLILFPKFCLDSEINNNLTLKDDDSLVNLDITTKNKDGNLITIYSGLCCIQIVEHYNLNTTVVPATGSTEVIDDQSLEHSTIWIDPVRSPYVYNNFNTGIENFTNVNTSNNFTIQHHNTYITQNVFNFNDNPRLSYDDYERRKKQNNNEDSLQSFNLDIYGNDEYECGVLLANFSEEVINDERVRDERLSLKEDSALKQLISTNKRSMKQKRTVLLVGDDSHNMRTVHNISVNDPNAECLGDIGSEVVIDNTLESSRNHKIYQCDKCKQIFDHISAFRQHIKGGHFDYEFITSYKSPKIYKNLDKTGEANFIYRCAECGKCLKSQDKFERHINGHGNPDLECAKCHKVYASKGSLKSHQKLHNRAYLCEWCLLSYTTKKELNSHLVKCHLQEENNPKESKTEENSSPSPMNYQKIGEYNDENMKADAVLARFMSEETFDHTKQSRHGGKKHCEICDKQFDRISDLKRHLIEHIVKSTLLKAPVDKSGALHMECVMCHNKIFSRIDQYKAHLREHAKLTLYKCTVCNKSFSDSSNFSKHKKIHASTRYQCDMCNRKFQSKRMISKHMEYHLNNPPMPCNQCGKVFYFSSMLKKHVKYFHSKMHAKGMATYQCMFCEEHLYTLKDKLDHEWKVHKSRRFINDCTECGQKFRKYSELKKHCNLIHGVKIALAKDRKYQIEINNSEYYEVSL